MAILWQILDLPRFEIAGFPFPLLFLYLFSLCDYQAEADANLGDFDWTADLSLFDEQVYAESLHEVPSLPDPAKPLPSSTKNKVKQDTSAVVPEFEDAFVVPDLGLNSSSPASHKRRRNIP